MHQIDIMMCALLRLNWCSYYWLPAYHTVWCGREYSYSILKESWLWYCLTCLLFSGCKIDYSQTTGLINGTLCMNMDRTTLFSSEGPFIPRFLWSVVECFFTFRNDWRNIFEIWNHCRPRWKFIHWIHISGEGVFSVKFTLNC